jgi:hypothetical protein
MGCIFVLIAGLFPRLALFIVWVARPKMVDAAFDTWIWPLLGFIFLPFATLMYVILWRTGGLSGWDWFWVALAAFLDLVHWGGSWTQRRTVPGYPATA